MTIKEKAAYVKGLFSGLDMEEDKKETKLLKAIVDWMNDVSVSLGNIDEDVDDICDQLDVLDKDLSEVEEEVYGECECDSPCDGECDCGCDGDEEFYEVTCPSCGEKICLSEDILMNEEMNCPKCGELLEFDLSDGCDCGCDCEPDCECDSNCDCGCDCADKE